MEDRGVGVSFEQDPRHAGGLVVVPAAELDDRDEVQQVFVVGPGEPRELELLPGLVEPSRLELFPGAAQVKKENRLVERGLVAGRLRG